jgi:signal transduction histidine kinase
MDNAVKFTDAGEIELTSRIENREIIIEIKDPGVGIADSIKKQVFGVFMQQDSSNTRKFEGSGNGLSIANGFIHLLGGKIWFDSEAGKGTTFFVSLPNNHGD